MRIVRLVFLFRDFMALVVCALACVYGGFGGGKLYGVVSVLGLHGLEHPSYGYLGLTGLTEQGLKYTEMVNLSMKQPSNWASMIVSLMTVLGVMIPTPLESIHSLGGNINFGLILPSSILP